LPSAAGLAIGRENDAIEAKPSPPLWIFQGRSATHDDFVAVANFRAVQHLFCQFRRLIVFGLGNAMASTLVKSLPIDRFFTVMAVSHRRDDVPRLLARGPNYHHHSIGEQSDGLEPRLLSAPARRQWSDRLPDDVFYIIVTI
jgi:hypothetical protein